MHLSRCQPGDGRRHFCRSKRFSKNCCESRVPIPLDLFRQSESSECDGCQLLEFPQFSQQIAPVAIPKADITYRQIDSFAFCNLQCGLIPVRRMNDMSARSDESCKHLKRLTVIFNEQDPRLRLSPFDFGIDRNPLLFLDGVASQLSRPGQYYAGSALKQAGIRNAVEPWCA